MDALITFLIAFTFGISLIPAILIFFWKNKNNRKLIRSILFTIVSFNAIWYSVLLIELIQSHLSINGYTEEFFNVISVSFMFVIRFIYLLSFLELLRILLNIKLSKKILSSIKGSGIIILIIWALGLIEYFTINTHIITSNLLLYSDILIFFIVIVSCIYLISQVKEKYTSEIQKSVRFLAIIFLLPMIFGLTKWIAGGIIEDNSLRDKLSIPFLIVVLNLLSIIWLIMHRNQFDKIKINNSEGNFGGDLIMKYNISKREVEVIQLICEGYTNKEIAEKLFISVETVKDHNSRIYLKTEVKNRTQLAKLFLQ